MNRNLDGVYFRVKRDDKYQSICFSDMTEEEQDRIMEECPKRYLKRLCKILARTIRDIGDSLDIVGDEENE